VAEGVIPLRTHIITAKDDLITLVVKYTADIAEPGDIIALAESMVAISQGRAVLPKNVQPGILARLISRFPGKDGSLATPQAMQLAIQEAGRLRILLGCAAAVLGRLLGRRGDFYRVAGQELALFDDVAGTVWPFEKHIVMGPKNAGNLAARIKEATGAEVAIVDVNDIKCVDIIGATDGANRDLVVRALRDNPFGNDDQLTPIAVIKPGLLKTESAED
jgi:hypothetical protein